MLISRTLTGLLGVNTLVTAVCKIRFQIAPGTAGGLGIGGAPFALSLAGAILVNGTVTADGEVTIPLLLALGGGLVLRVFDTDYPITIRDDYQDASTLAGQQRRLDVLGYLSGYQLRQADNAAADDGKDGPRTQQSIMNFQMDQHLAIDGEVGPRTTAALRREAGA